MLGLNITRSIDERRDIEKSTLAAATYLSKLHGQFGDWTLAIAAYNCGPGNLRKAIRKSGGKTSFWDIKKYLPRETREYVPKFIAISYVMNYYYDHDLTPKQPHDNLIFTSTAQVYEELNLKTLSKELDIDLSIIKTLNPAFIRNFIPKSDVGKYTLVLPTDEMRIVADRYDIRAALPLLEVEKVEEIVEVTEEPRPLLKVNDIPAAVYIRSEEDDHNPEIKSMYIHPVGIYEDQSKDKFILRDAFYLKEKQKTIFSISKLIKKSA